jgi:GT2 family glycosyltransferase
VARNRALAETAADIVTLTDDDVVVDRDWLRHLVEPFADADVGAVTGLVMPLELATPTQKRFEQYAGFSKGFTRRSFDLRADRADDRLLYPFWGGIFGSGGSVAYRRRAMVAAGGYDPALGAGSRALAGADIEALSAVVLRGERLVYEPRSLCWHEHHRDEVAFRRQVFNYGVGFTAILTKAALHDRRFAGAVARSVPLVWTLRRDRRGAAPESRAARPGPEVRRLECAGMVQGPARYLASVLWSRRLGLGRVVDGG